MYQELRRLAAAKMAHESPGQTLQPTALVHEVWLRLGRAPKQNWQNRAHFFRVTPAEVAILRLIAEGNANKQIADRLSITEDTVKSRVKNILSKLGANDRTHAAMLGLKRGIIDF